MVLELAEAGADAFVLFNRFYQPNIDAARLQLRNNLKLSEPGKIRLPLLWIRVLADRVNASLAATARASRKAASIDLGQRGCRLVPVSLNRRLGGLASGNQRCRTLFVVFGWPLRRHDDKEQQAYGVEYNSTREERKRRDRPMKFHRILIAVDSGPIALR
jgi:hypothetical protein